MSREYCVYIMASESKTIYIGVTNNIYRRILEHKNGEIEVFTKKYNCNKLIFVEVFEYIYDALNAEKKIKKWKREWKVNLIEENNPFWEDLSEKW